ncbi:MAG: type II toxin-antitoxin system VapC family toxin [Acidobacteriota bacterium]|nr:type II toxin-antitoxin system VapC family toxin [Acidobacteriota bacterium]
MKLLLDTHAFIWFVYDSPKLPRKTKELLEDEQTELLLSTASVWEMAIKASMGKLTLISRAADLAANQLQKDAIDILPITLPHIDLVESLPFHHKDPFDRLLIAQTAFEHIDIVSIDTMVDRYGIRRVWLA